jgi:hypothetical protein
MSFSLSDCVTTYPYEAGDFCNIECLVAFLKNRNNWNEE